MIHDEQVLAVGLVNKVIESDELLTESIVWAEKLAQKPSIAMKMMKMMKTSVNRGTGVDLQTALDLETACFGSAFVSEDGLKE